MNYFNYNGKLHKEGSPVIGADNRGLRYGDGVFETIKMKNGKMIFEDEHFARLWKGLLVLQFDIPRHFTAERLQGEIKELAKKNNHETAARIRLNIVRGNGGLYDTINQQPHYMIQTFSLADNMGSWNSNGLVLGIYTEAKKSCDILSNCKHNNYLVYVLAALAAKKEKWNDAVVLNTFDRICDSTIANIFIVNGRIVYTPSLKEGCVAGIMRKMVIQTLLKAGWEIVETELSINDLLTADEVFLTSSIHNIRWVQRIGDVTYQNVITRMIYADISQTIS